MIQKEKIRGVGYFLMALAAGLLPFAAPDACAQALREGLALCGGPLLLSLFPFLIVSTLLIQCPAADVLDGRQSHRCLDRQAGSAAA